MNKYLIWDFDNTLARRKGGWSSTLLEIIQNDYPSLYASKEMISPFMQTGFPWHTPEVINASDLDATLWWNRLDSIFINALHIGCQFDLNISKEIANKIRIQYSNIDRWELFGDTVFILEYAKQNGWINVVLSNHVPELDDIVAGLGINKYIQQIFNSAKTGIEKPNPKAYEQIITSFSSESRLLMVGDNVKSDYEAPIKCGINALLVHSDDNNIKRKVENLTDLVPWLQ
ncbi:MAG: HAD family hydrolase [bacterium]|nr:HAD family hydrolase [bacterium]